MHNRINQHFYDRFFSAHVQVSFCKCLTVRQVHRVHFSDVFAPQVTLVSITFTTNHKETFGMNRSQTKLQLQ